jgi:hypothetical protein
MMRVSLSSWRKNGGHLEVKCDRLSHEYDFHIIWEAYVYKILIAGKIRYLSGKYILLHISTEKGNTMCFS